MVSRLDPQPFDVALDNIPYHLSRDPRSQAPLYTVRTVDAPEITSLTRGRVALDDIGQRLEVLLFDDSALGFGDSRRNPHRSGLSIHRTMNVDVSSGYAVPAPTFRSANSTVRRGTVAGLYEVTYNSLPAMVYANYNQAIRLEPAGTETEEQAWSSRCRNLALFDGRIYACFDSDDNLWRRTGVTTSTSVTWDRQAGTDTTMTQVAVAASGDDAEDVYDGTFSLTTTTIRTGRLANGSVAPNVGASTDDASEGVLGAMNLTGTTITMALNFMGLRFSSVSVPQGATITSATITIELNAAVTGSPALAIRGFANDNPGTFTSTSNDISNRAITTGSASWTVPTGGVAGDRINTASITTVVQEIVNRS